MATQKRISREALALKLLWRTNITGLSHSNYSLISKQIEVGDELQLQARVDNSFDNEAVAVGYLDTADEFVQVGWLPAKERAAKGIIHKMLLSDLDVRCKIISHDPLQALDQRLYVGIYIRIE